jgi:hypothetical protein
MVGVRLWLATAEWIGGLVDCIVRALQHGDGCPIQLGKSLAALCSGFYLDSRCFDALAL